MKFTKLCDIIFEVEDKCKVLKINFKILGRFFYYFEIQ